MSSLVGSVRDRPTLGSAAEAGDTPEVGGGVNGCAARPACKLSMQAQHASDTPRGGWVGWSVRSVLTISVQAQCVQQKGKVAWQLAPPPYTLP